MPKQVEPTCVTCRAHPKFGPKVQASSPTQMRLCLSIHSSVRPTLSSPLLSAPGSPVPTFAPAPRMAAPLARAPLLRAPLRPSPTAFRLALRRHIWPLVPPYAAGGAGGPVLRTCKSCKKQYDPAANHPSACRYHTAHFGGETKRKFESVYAGGTMDTPDSGKVFQYWHCCGSEDPFDAGCTAAPHCSYDD